MKEKTQRLFFALWPDDSIRQQIAAVSRQLDPKQGRRVAARNLHITLTFLGASTPVQYSCYCEAAQSIQATEFTLQLDSFGYWKKPRVAWLGCSRTPQPLLQLVEDLTTALQTCGFAPEQRRYEPHVTLMRKAVGICEPKNFRPLHWTADRFCLVESVTQPEGVEYHVLREWQFD